MSNEQRTKVDDFHKNFPFQVLRERQSYVLNEIATAFDSGYKYVLLEAPTGFGKSPVAIAVALTLDTSYICTSTKDLQTQYARDFSFVKMGKGKNNFTCAVKDDFIKNGTYRCGSCISNNANECYHTAADYGPCMSNEDFRNRNCKYRTFLDDYKISNKGTREEKVFIDYHTREYYQEEYNQWLYLKNLKEELRVWRQCEYYDQLNIASASSHSIFNYSNFLAFLTDNRVLRPRELLVLDEAHLPETEIVGFRGISISKRKWKKYIPNLKIVDYGYDDIEKWIDFLIDLETKMLCLTGNGFRVDMLSNQRGRVGKRKTPSNAKKITSASEIFEIDKEIEEKYFSATGSSSFGKELGEERVVEVIRDTERLTRVINNILSNPKNWIVSEIKKEDYEVISVDIKRLVL